VIANDSDFKALGGRGHEQGICPWVVSTDPYAWEYSFALSALQTPVRGTVGMVCLHRPRGVSRAAGLNTKKISYNYGIKPCAAGTQAQASPC
jgi:hypothetical protein